MKPTPSPATAPEKSPGRSSRRPSTSIGVAAGILAGGAIGLAAGVPSLTSAASDDSVAVALQDDTTEPTDEPTDEATDETTDETTDERVAPGERLREALQPLVDDGTIDAGQADAVASHLVENGPDRSGRPGRRGVDGRDHTIVADVLGIDSETLRAELRAGNSIADIAEANGVDVQTVVDALIEDVEGHLDLAIEHGLDEEQAAERLERLAERIEAGVHRTPGGRSADG